MMLFCYEDVFFIFPNSEDSDKMPFNMAYHMGLYGLQNYLFTGILNEKC